MTTHRWPALLVLAAAIGGLVLADRHRPAAVGLTYGRGDALLQPVAPPADAITSAWFCPGVPAGADKGRDGRFVVVNPSDAPLTATMTVVAADGGPTITQNLQIAARSRAEVRPADSFTASFAAAQVEVAGANALVEQLTHTDLGDDISACATGASPTWYFADGRTTVDASFSLMVFNPFPDDAVIDVTFATEEGTRVPTALKGFVVRAHAMRVVLLDDQVQRNKRVSTDLVARTGRVVVGRYQVYRSTPKGVVAGLAAPSAASSWWFAGGEKGTGIAERYVVYNPGAADAQVTLSAFPEAGLPPVPPPDTSTTDTTPDTSPDTTPATTPETTVPGASTTTPATPSSTPPTTAPGADLGYEPIVVTVPAGSATVIDVSAAAGIAAGRHFVLVTTDDATPVVVERRTEFKAAAGGVLNGVSDMLGARVTADHWAFPAWRTDAVVAIAIANPTGQPVTVDAQSIGPGGELPVPGGQQLVLAPGAVTVINLNDAATSGLPIDVVATGPIVAERFVGLGQRVGTSWSLGLPFVS